MKAELHTNPAVFDTLQSEWDTLLHPEDSTEFFMTHAWQRVWWKHLGRGELAVVTIRDESGILCGIGPWFVEQNGGERIVRTVGCEAVADYLSILARPGFETEVFNALLNFMLSPQAPAWDAFELCNVPHDSLTLQYLPNLAEDCGLLTQIVQEDVCPVVDLPGTYEAYLESLDKKQRHELRRKRRRAEDYGVDHYVVGPEHALPEEIDAFLELMSASTSEKAAFLEERGHREFFREMGKVMFEQGNLVLLFLTIEGQRAAAMWQFAYKDRMMLYNSGLNPSAFAALSPGIVLLTFSVEDAIQRGLTKYDFLQGEEEYKFRMGSRATTVHNLTIRRRRDSGVQGGR